MFPHKDCAVKHSIKGNFGPMHHLAANLLVGAKFPPPVGVMYVTSHYRVTGMERNIAAIAAGLLQHTALIGRDGSC